MNTPEAPFPGAHVSTIRVAGRATRVLDAGEGPTIVCSPGIASLVWDWVPFARCQAADFRVIVVERTSSEQFEHTLTADADHLMATLDALGVEGPVTLVGHSFGALVVEAVGRLHPGRAIGLALLDGSVVDPDAFAGHDSEHAPAPGSVSAMVNRIVTSRAAHAAWRVLGPAMVLALVPARARVARSVAGLAPLIGAPAVLQTCVNELRRYDARTAQLAHLRRTSPLPPDLTTLVVAANGRLPWHGHSRWVRAVLRQADDLAREADVRAVVVRRSGHFVMLDQPQRVAELVAQITPR